MAFGTQQRFERRRDKPLPDDQGAVTASEQVAVHRRGKMAFCDWAKSPWCVRELRDAANDFRDADKAERKC